MADEKAIYVFDPPKSLDPRMYAAGFFKPTDPSARSMKVAAACDIFNINGNEHVLLIPSHAAMCLNISQKAHLEVSKLNLGDPFDKVKGAYVAIPRLGMLYQIFELLIQNTVFACCAIEAFVNQVIPDDYIHEHVWNGKKRKLDKEKIERNLSTSDKLTKVLPKIYNSSLKKGTTLWNQYHDMKTTRDRIIHVKSSDLGIGSDDEQSIWETLITRKDIDCSVIAHNVIQQFTLPKENSTPVAAGRNRWIKQFPFRQSQ